MNGVEDIISDLPREIIECILACMPIRDAGRTSILSHKWRYFWTAHPQLIFDNHSNIVGTPNPRMKLVNTIDKVFVVHSGPLIKALNHIGFPDMTSVSLENCMSLTIVSIAPYLNPYCGGTTNTNLFELVASLPRLARLTMDSFILMVIAGDAAKVLHAGDVSHRLPPVNHLRSIHLHRIDFNDLAQIWHIIWLLYTFNNLDEVEIAGVGGMGTINHSDSNFWEKLPPICQKVERLRNVKLVLFQCLKTQLSFIEYLLSRCQNLERMVIQFENFDKKEGVRISSELLRFRRASRKAGIFCKLV